MGWHGFFAPRDCNGNVGEHRVIEVSIDSVSDSLDRMTGSEQEERDTLVSRYCVSWCLPSPSLTCVFGFQVSALW